MTVTPGVRGEIIWTSYDDRLVDRQSSELRASVLPGASIQWQIEEHLSVFAGVMRGFAPVTPGQAPTVAPEDSIDWEAGARFAHAESRTTAMVTGFVNDYSIYIQQCSVGEGCASTSVDAQANGGRPIVGGFDVRVSSTPAIGDVRIPLRASYTFTYSELREAILDSPDPQFLNGRPGDHLPYLPEHQIVAQAGLETQPFGVNVSASFVSEMWEGVGQGDDSLVPRTDALFLLDASLYVQIFREMRLYVQGENLTMTQVIAARRPYGARPNRPFQIQGGVQLSL